MKFLHTSDWHLGLRLLGKDMEVYQQKALQWLLHSIEEHSIDVLIIAGDIFDNGQPSNAARSMYFNFLRDLIKSSCQHVIIIGGNHDSPSMLNAPGEVLQMLNVHVIGKAIRDENEAIDVTQEIIVLKNNDGQPEAVIGAVPFLRDRDIMSALAGQTFDDRVLALRKGIEWHYQKLAEAMSKYSELPKIATGHLYVAGSNLSDNAERQEGENDIHIGNLAKVNADLFSQPFDYTALGHIHMAQTPGSTEHIRYSGSLIPLSFSERNDQKQVNIVDFNAQNKALVTPLLVPYFVRLIRFKGKREEIENALLTKNKIENIPIWGEFVFTEKVAASVIERYKELASEGGIDILKVIFDIPRKPADSHSVKYFNKKPEELSLEDIFSLRCLDQNLSELETLEITQTFTELKNITSQNE